jgi:DNA-binding transcriptional MerR regulator
MATKYRIQPSHLEERHGIARLERDGFSREDISKALYKHTEGSNQQNRTEIMKKLHDRKGEC